MMYTVQDQNLSQHVLAMETPWAGCQSCTTLEFSLNLFFISVEIRGNNRIGHSAEKLPCYWSDYKKWQKEKKTHTYNNT